MRPRRLGTRLLIATLLLPAVPLPASARFAATPLPPSGIPHERGGRFPGIVEAQAVGVQPTQCMRGGQAYRCFDLGLKLVVQSAERQQWGFSLFYTLDRSLFARLRRDFGDQGPILIDAFQEALRRARKDAGPEHAAALDEMLDRLEGAPHYSVVESIVLPQAIEERIAELAHAFYRLRGKRLLVTSGTRTATAQAEAMYLKLKLRANLRRLYGRKRALRAIYRAYRQARPRKAPASAVIAAMAQVIASQVKAGIYISSHLRAGAIDIRSRGMTRADLHALRRLCRRRPWIRHFKWERRPPHIHLNIATD